MDLVTELNQDDFPQLFVEFERSVGESSWRNIVRKVTDEIKGNRFLASYLKNKYRVVFALQALSEFRGKHGHMLFSVDRPELYEACVLVVLFADIQRRVGKRQGVALARRIAGAVKKPDDLRALQFELQLAVHFAKRGYDIDFPDNDAETYDLLARNDGFEVEIECKSVSADKGRQVHRREALEIHHLIERELRPLLRSLQVGLLLRIVFNKRPPRGYNDRLSLVKEIKRTILSGKTRLLSDYEVRLMQFDMTMSPFANGKPSEVVLKSFLETNGVVNRESMVFGVTGKNVVLITLESLTQDQFLRETFEAISEAAKRQLTGKRPGFVCVKFEDLDAKQMHEIGMEQGEPAALRIWTTKFLTSSAAKNLTALSFFADDELTGTASGAVTRGGVNYIFTNPENVFAAEVVERGLFT